MYIRHRVRRSGEYAKPVARGRLDPERLGLLLLLFSFRRRVAIVFQGPPSNDLRGRKSYLATNPLNRSPLPPSLNEEIEIDDSKTVRVRTNFSKDSRREKKGETRV